MKTAIIQMNIAWGDISTNCQTASMLIDSMPGQDLYILPEMFSTGFATQPQGIADNSNETLTWMISKANQTGVAICGSVAVDLHDYGFRNRMYFVKPGDTLDSVCYYDKRHLFSYGGENINYTAGEKRIITEWHGVRFLLQICYDLRFPVFARNNKDYDAIIYVASWPTSRISVWNILLQARAIENQCYVLACNRIGNDPRCTYSGGSQIIDAYGRIKCSADTDTQESICTSIDMEKLCEFRTKFPVLGDADRIIDPTSAQNPVPRNL